MIEISFNVDKPTKTAEISVKGHSGSAKKGRDLVCAAASMLLYTLAQETKNIADEGKPRVPLIIKLGNGDAYIKASFSDKPSFERLLGAFRTIRTGYLLMERNYPAYVRVNKKE